MITDTKLMMEQLTSESMTTDEKIISEQISEDANSCLKNSMRNGVAYYETDNIAIKNKQHTYYKVKGADINNNEYDSYEEVVDNFRANNKIASSFIKLLIDQKASYVAGNEVVINNIDNITSILDINDFLNKMIKESSKKGVEWAHPYINNSGEFKIRIISGEEVIPIFDTNFVDELVGVIRYYPIKVLKGDGKEVTRKMVEVWDNEKVTYFQEDENKEGSYHKYYNVNNECNNGECNLSSSFSNPRYYFSFETTLAGNKVSEENQGWGKVPFVPLYNNDQQETDLKPIKDSVDARDRVLSDLQDNLDDVQDIITVLSGCMASNKEKARIQEHFKRTKMHIGNEGEQLSTITQDVPYQGRIAMVQQLTDDIYRFGRGVDVDKLAGGSLTNVVIKARYSALDLKANETIIECKKFIKELFWFANEYLRLTNKAQDDLSKMKIIFNKSMIFNTSEMITDVSNSIGVISNETAISNHPFVNNYEDEAKKIEAEKEKEINNIPDVEEEE